MTQDQVEPSVACSLQPTELSDRRGVWKRLLERALREQRPIPGGVRLVLAPKEGVERELRELARLEGQCCAFAEWRVQRRGDEIVLEVTAPAEAVAAVRALFDRPLRTERST